MFRVRAEVVVAGVVTAKALFWTDIVTVVGLFVTDFAQSDYDHFSYDHLCVVSNWVFGDVAFEDVMVSTVPPDIILHTIL